MDARHCRLRPSRKSLQNHGALRFTSSTNPPKSLRGGESTACPLADHVDVLGLQTGRDRHRGTLCAENAAVSSSPFHTQQQPRQPEPPPAKSRSTYPGSPPPGPATAPSCSSSRALPAALNPSASTPQQGTARAATPRLSPAARVSPDPPRGPSGWWGAPSLNQLTPEPAGGEGTCWDLRGKDHPPTLQGHTSPCAAAPARCVSPACCGQRRHRGHPASSSSPVPVQDKEVVWRPRAALAPALGVRLCHPGTGTRTQPRPCCPPPRPLAPRSTAAPTCEGTFFGGSIRIEGSHSPGGKTVT